MVKSVVLLFLLLLTLYGCKNNSSQYSDSQIESSDVMSFSSKVVSNEEDARKIADFALENTLKHSLEEYKIVNVYPKEKNWIVSYGIDEYTLGGDIAIEISGENGEIISVVFGE